jgi:hypothetical protein
MYWKERKLHWKIKMAYILEKLEIVKSTYILRQREYNRYVTNHRHKHRRHQDYILAPCSTPSIPLYKQVVGPCSTSILHPII